MWSMRSQADRAGKADEFAALYDASSLRRENDDRLDQVSWRTCTVHVDNRQRACIAASRLQV